MLNLGIEGFGNLGKSLLELAEKDKNLNVATVFSRRRLDIQKYASIDEIDKYVDKIDILVLAVGSFSDFGVLTQKIAGKFHTVDSFDNHSKISEYKNSIKSSNKISVVSVGWDPGILSMARALFSIFDDSSTATFWGKGISQGHSNAIRTIDGVLDAVQFTVPKEDVLSEAKNGKIKTADSTKNHERVCFVAAENGKENFISETIVNMPDYFKPYKTSIHFVGLPEVRKMKKDMSHRGCVCSKNAFGNLNFEISANSNPMLTAAIMLQFVKAVPKLYSDGFFGTLDCLDIPLKYLIDNKNML